MATNMTTTLRRLWCIKNINGKAFILKDGKPLKGRGQKATEFMNLRQAEEIALDGKMLLRLKFWNQDKNVNLYASLSIEKFNPFQCDPPFNKLSNKSNLTEFVKGVNSSMELLVENAINSIASGSIVTDDSRSSELSDVTGTSHDHTPTQSSASKISIRSNLQLTTPTNKEKDADDCSSGKKKKITAIYTTPKTSKSKKLKDGDENIHLQIQESCKKKRINGIYEIPMRQVRLPPQTRQVRSIDKVFVTELKKRIKAEPAGNHEPLFLEVKGLCQAEDFVEENVSNYTYEVLGGTHLTLATKELLEEGFLEFKTRVARLFVGLTDEEALWLGARHNVTGSFRHEMYYKDEVEICRAQLFSGTHISLTHDCPEPDNNWRSKCSAVLSKQKKSLTEIFSMALLSGEGWKYFLDINEKYQKMQLKNQKAKSRREIVCQPMLKQNYFKNICSLDMKDKVALLKKVSNGEITLDDMAQAAKEIKKLQPVQGAIIAFFGLNAWEEVVSKFGNEVSGNKLARFMGCKLDDSQDFRGFLERLADMNNNENTATNSLLPSEVFQTPQGNIGTVLKSTTEDFGPRHIACNNHTRGAFLSCMEVGHDSQNSKKMTKDVLDTVKKINYTKLNAFNVAVLTPISTATAVQEAMNEEGAAVIQNMFICVPRKHFKQDSLELQSCVEQVVIGHFSITQTLTKRQINGESRDNFLVLSSDKNLDVDEKPIAIYEWLVNYLSQDGDMVLDFGSFKGNGFAAALKAGRPAVLVSNLCGQQYDELVVHISKNIGTKLISKDIEHNEEEV